LGVVHRIWPVTDVATITAVTAAMGNRPMYIADGHHRYETAIALRDQLAAELAQRGNSLPPEHPANFVLMMCVSMSDPGMMVLATHRLFRGLPPISSTELRERLGSCFSCEPAGSGADRARSLWEEVEVEGEQSTFGFYTAADDRWTMARLTDAGRRRMAEVAGDHSPEWQSLGVSILHRLVIDTLLLSKQQGAGSREPMTNDEFRMSNDESSNSSFVIRHSSFPELPAPKYVRDIDELVRSLNEGDATGRDATGQAGTGGRFELAALVMPATVEHIRTISGHGERMPAKSTYFYPKLLSGLVINPLE
jgi:hypothetical protein